MNSNKKTNLVLKITLILTILSTLALIFSFRWCFNSASGYFVISAPPIVFWVTYIGGIICSVIATLLIDKKQIIKTPSEVGKMQLPLIILACMLTVTVLLCNILFDNELLIFGNLGIYAFVIYTLLCSLKGGYRPGAAKILLLYASILFPVSMEIINSTNYTRHINSVENTLATLFEIFFMLYILYEAKRIHTGEHSRWHLGTMLLAVHSGLSYSIAYVVAYLTKSVDEPIRLFHTTLILLISLLIEFELLRFVKKSEFHTQEEWNTINNPNEEIAAETTSE